MAPKHASLAVLAAGVSAAIDCSFDAVQQIMPGGVDLSFATPISENGAFTVPSADTDWPVNPIKLPALCAVAATVTSAENGTFGFGIFLPTVWNERTLTVGNGGLAGGVNWIDMGTGVKYGHAVISTDTGHNGTTTQAAWAYNNTKAQTNWGWRALHESVVYGKQIIESFYDKAPVYHYYQVCSTGGRQGFKEAEMFPDDFDGVIAGAPAWWTSHQQIWQFWTGYINYISNISSIPETMFDVIGCEVLRQCDPQDGVVDNIISNPYGCDFDAEQLLCGKAGSSLNTTSCLTPEQLATFDTLTHDFTTTNSTLVFPKWLLGAEHFWNLNIAGGSPNIIGLGYIQYFLGLGASWNWRDFDDDVVQLSETLNAGQADASDYNLEPFYTGGKKFIHYHGLSDGGIATGASYYWYEHIDRALTPKGIDLDDFYRFFPIPGMGHCTDTADHVNAPYFIAGISMTNNGRNSVPGYQDSKHDVLLALMDWVENGTAPEFIIGTAWQNFTTEEVVTRQRPICPHPQLAKYKGEGDPDDANSWECGLLYEKEQAECMKCLIKDMSFCNSIA
ncbi:putative feruloyl esterase B-1 [Pseudocercospora fuligena]|uniref:Carboxylic ester hydrolase n=1 Tax=Pseudocercospora fuligena TaxID=685502 RepID=A0A8H6VKQ0_9PEZI|nr:putative feruloyl esterase B-1 [Pseudocercospora fuligena]